MARGDPVDGVAVVGNLDAPTRQLIPKSYRPQTGRSRGRGKPCKARAEDLGRCDEGLPEPLAGVGIQRREDLAATGVEHGEARHSRRRGLDDRPAKRIERADAGDRQSGAGGEAARRRQPDPDADEGAGTAADRDRAHLAPAANRRHRTLDLGEQSRRVAGGGVVAQPQPLFVGDLAAARRADDGVGRRRVEADDRPLAFAPLSQ